MDMCFIPHLLHLKTQSQSRLITTDYFTSNYRTVDLLNKTTKRVAYK